MRPRAETELERGVLEILIIQYVLTATLPFPMFGVDELVDYFRIQMKLSLNTITVVFSCKSLSLIYYSFVLHPVRAIKSFMVRMDQCCRGLRVHNDFAYAVGSSSLNLLTKRGCTEHRYHCSQAPSANSCTLLTIVLVSTYLSINFMYTRAPW